MKILLKILSFLRDFLPHATIAMALVLLTFFILDRFNRAMNFIANDITKWMLAIFCGMVVTLAVLYIVERRKKK